MSSVWKGISRPALIDRIDRLCIDLSGSSELPERSKERFRIGGAVLEYTGNRHPFTLSPFHLPPRLRLNRQQPVVLGQPFRLGDGADFQVAAPPAHGQIGQPIVFGLAAARSDGDVPVRSGEWPPELTLQAI